MTTTDDVAAALGLVWEDPPTSHKRPGPEVRRRPTVPDPLYLRIVEALRTHPGRWARIAQFEERQHAAAEADRLFRGREAAFFPPHEYEFTSRTNRVYARYLGDTHDHH